MLGLERHFHSETALPCGGVAIILYRVLTHSLFFSLHSHPLFKPCKCSGSIGLTHQDCLVSWLQVQRGNGGACELCQTRFRFAPQYAPDAPERLPAAQVFIGLTRQFIAKWCPFALRISAAASLWLMVAPLVTAWLYHAWMHRPGAMVRKSMLMADLVSGAVVAAYIIISFLSFMSFADFLRVEWQQRGLGPRRAAQQQAPAPRAPDEDDIDDGVWLQVQAEHEERHGFGRRGRHHTLFPSSRTR